MLEIVLTLCESDQYSSAPKEISKFPLMYMTGYFCRSVYMSHVMRKQAFCICKNKEADQLRSYYAKLISAFVFRYTDSTIPLLP